jgi:hypothetical protein
MKCAVYLVDCPMDPRLGDLYRYQFRDGRGMDELWFSFWIKDISIDTFARGVGGVFGANLKTVDDNIFGSPRGTEESSSNNRWSNLPVTRVTIPEMLTDRDCEILQRVGLKDFSDSVSPVLADKASIKLEMDRSLTVVPSDLLTMMWLQIVKAVNIGTGLAKRCKLSACGEWYERRRSDQLYCCRSHKVRVFTIRKKAVK